MINAATIAQKRICANKSESVMIIISIAIATATLITAFSLSVNYLDFFLKESENLTDSSLSQILKNSLSNFKGMALYIVEFLVYFNSLPSSGTEGAAIPPPVAKNADDLFSPEAMVENLPLIIIFMLAVVLITVYFSLSIVFSVCEKERRGFYATLMSSGASYKFIKKCAYTEAFDYCHIAFIIGIILGLFEISAIRLAAVKLFESLSSEYIGIVFPVEIHSSGRITFAVVLPLIQIMVYFMSSKFCKKLSVKTIASGVKSTSDMNIGLRTFSAKPQTYKRFGIEFFIAFRNFINNLGKYIKIIFMTVMYVALIGITFIMFNASTEFNNQVMMQTSREILSFSFASELYICSLTAAVAAVTLVCTFCSVSANINSNTGEYALMKSAGSSLKSILKTVRIEGFYCTLFGITFSLFSIFYFARMVSQIYREDTRVAFGGFDSVGIVSGIAVLLFALSVVFTIIHTSKKMKKINLIGTLKDLFY